MAVDCHGDALPAGAIARLGTVRFRGPVSTFEGRLCWLSGSRLMAGGRSALWVLGLDGRVEQRHPVDQLSGVGVSPDGKTIGVCSYDGTLTLLDAETFETRAVLADDLRTPTGVWFSDSGDRVVVSTYTGEHRHYLLPGNTRDTATQAPPAGTPLISPDGRHSARIQMSQFSAASIEIIDRSTDTPLPRPDGLNGEIQKIRLAPDGGIFTHSMCWTAAMWAPDGALRWRTDEVARDAVLDPSAGVVLHSHTYQAPVEVIDAATGEHRTTLPHDGLPRVYDPDRKATLINGPGVRPDNLRLMRADGTILCSGPGHAGLWSDLRGGRLLHCRGEATIHDIHTPGMPQLSKFRVHRTGCGVLTPDGTTLITGGDTGILTARNALTGEKLWKKKISRDGMCCAALSGDLLVVGNRKGQVQLIDLSKRRLIQTFTGHEGRVTALAISADGQTIYSGGEDTTVLVWSRTA